ncbi:MAG: hypothetical protein WC517_00205 [Patescibacteria group bacterium]
MFFKPKKAIPAPEPAAAEAPQGFSDVYVMPEKYVMPGAKTGGKGLLIVSIILIAVILLTASYLIYDMMNSQPAAVTPAPIPPQIEVMEVEQPLIEATSTIEAVATTTGTEITSQPTSTPALTPAALSVSLDSDGDGLSDIEETLLGTLPTNIDTDGDGYRDGSEVAGGYNPTKPGDSRLKESPFIKSLATNFSSDNFKTLYPKDWLAAFVAANRQALITAATGEIIRISIRDNQLGQSALGWYLQDHPEAIVSQLRVAEAGVLSGIYTANGLTAYLTDPAKTKFYVFEYLAGQQLEVRYGTVFAAIIKSFELTAPAAALAPNASSSADQVCQGYLCYEEPCGPLVSGENSCLSATLKKTCHERACEIDSDCPTGQICVEISCWNGDLGEIAKVCK